LFIGVCGISQQELKISVPKLVINEVGKEDSAEIVLNQSINGQITAVNGNGHAQQLSEKKREELIRQIENIMGEKAFKDPHCSIDIIAKKIGSNSKYVSQVINDKLGCSFTNYVNDLRIREAQQILSEQKSERYSIEGVGIMVGFQSKSTFNTQFKKVTGMTPTEYLRTIKS
jgi:YesN/AraC family two-component response regulator